MENAPGAGFPRFLPAGTGALVVEFSDTVNEAANEAVLALDRAVGAAGVDGVIELVPTYRSLLVHFDPVRIGARALRDRLSQLLDAGAPESAPPRTWTIPVCYGGAFGMDLEWVAEQRGLSANELIALHSGSPLRVYMIGFAPGFAYLGGLDPRLHTSRRVEPRLRTPPRSISIGGAQSAVNPPFELPSGWHMLGQTPVRTYDPARHDRPFLLEAGDLVRFRPVDPDEYEALCAREEAGDRVAVLETPGEDGR